MDKETIDILFKSLEKKWGKGIVHILSQDAVETVETIHTGSLALDAALGVGGWPRGRIIEIYGPEGAGKSTLCLHLVAEAQKLGDMAAYIDMEHGFSPKYARNIGVNLDSLIISQPETSEQALDIVEVLVRTNEFGAIILDSVAALVPKVEVEEGSPQVGLVARQLASHLRKISPVVDRTRTVLVFVNQIREKIGQSTMMGMPALNTPGGRALKHWASIRLDLKKKELDKVQGIVAGITCIAKVMKNKLAAPYRECTFPIVFGRGIDKFAELVAVSEQMGFLSKKGTWYNYDGENIGQGLRQTAAYLESHLELADKLTTLIRQGMFSGEEIGNGEQPDVGEGQAGT